MSDVIVVIAALIATLYALYSPCFASILPALPVKQKKANDIGGLNGLLCLRKRYLALS